MIGKGIDSIFDEMLHKKSIVGQLAVAQSQRLIRLSYPLLHSQLLLFLLLLFALFFLLPLFSWFVLCTLVNKRIWRDMRIRGNLLSQQEG